MSDPTRVRVVMKDWDPDTARVELEDGTVLDYVEKVEIVIVPGELARVTLTLIAPIVDVTGEVQG